MGTDIPLNGVRDLTEQEKIVGRIDHWGAMYHFDEYVEPEDISAVDFMIDQVSRYPHEVTLISVGAATNIAMACQKDSNFASGTAGIVYMGTTIEEQGTFTPYADFNCFYDADAYDVCLNSDFPAQMVVPHDLSGCNCSGMLFKS